MVAAPAGRQSRRTRLLPRPLRGLGPRDSQKNALQPQRKRQWCIGRVSGEYLARLEAVLALYVRPYDPRHPVVCFDERPCFLLGDAVEGLAPQPGKPEKEPYAYTKHGRCGVLAAVEPLTGQRRYQVRGQRTKRAYVQFMQRLARRYAGAEAIYVVQAT